MLVLGERLRRLQWVAVASAAVGVFVLFWRAGELPWIGLVLAIAFGFYSLLRKTTVVDPLTGNTVENVPVESLTTDNSSAAPVDSGETAGGFCTQYPTWYDSQVAYENLGATAADPALVQEVDPDYNGIACEGYMQ